MKKSINILILLLFAAVLTSCSKKPEPSPYYFYIESLQRAYITDEKAMYRMKTKESSMEGNESILLKEIENYKYYSSTAYDKDTGILYYTNLTFDFIDELYSYDVESEISTLFPIGPIDSATSIKIVEDGLFFLAYDRDLEDEFRKPYLFNLTTHEGKYIPWEDTDKRIVEVYQNVYTDDFVMLAENENENGTFAYSIYSYESFNTTPKLLYSFSDLTGIDLLLLKEGIIISGNDESNTLVFKKLKYETQEVEDFPLEIKGFIQFVGTNPQESHLYYVNNSRKLVDLTLASKKENIICVDVSTATIQKTNKTP